MEVWDFSFSFEERDHSEKRENCRLSITNEHVGLTNDMPFHTNDICFNEFSFMPRNECRSMW